MAEINDLNVTSASNTARWPEQMRVNQVNNAARDTESIIARWHRDTNGSVAVSGTNTYTATINADTGFTLYDGFVFWGDFANANTGAATINLTPDGGSALGAKAITKAGSSALIASDITTGMKVALVYDGTNFQMMSPPGTGAAGGTVTSVAAGAGFSFATITGAGTIAVDGVLQDLDTTGVVGADSEFLVGTGAGAMAWESASTALTSIGGIGAATTTTMTNKTLDADGTGNVISNIDIGNAIAASQAEAQAGTNNTKLVTPLRVKEAIAALETTLSQATQSAIEAETNENTYAPPDLIKHNPGVAKFWCNFNGGSSGPISPVADYNVVDITDNGTGDYTVNISTDFSTADWCVIALCKGGGTNVNDRNLINIYTTSSPMTAGTVRLFLIRVRGAGSANSAENSSLMSVAGFGDQ